MSKLWIKQRHKHVHYYLLCPKCHGIRKPPLTATICKITDDRQCALLCQTFASAFVAWQIMYKIVWRVCKTTMVDQTSLMGPLIIMGDGQLALYSDCLLFCWLSFLKTMHSYSALFNVRTENNAFVLQFLNSTDRRFIITRNGLWPKLCQILVWKAPI